MIVLGWIFSLVLGLFLGRISNSFGMVWGRIWAVQVSKSRPWEGKGSEGRARGGEETRRRREERRRGADTQRQQGEVYPTLKGGCRAIVGVL